tara:strand:- start:5367 stop:5582 length:216 start_codon:yes stop_codon:yes gene_type:complete
MICRIKVREGILSKDISIGSAIHGYGFEDITLGFGDLSTLNSLKDEEKLMWLNQIYTRMIPPNNHPRGFKL